MDKLALLGGNKAVTLDYQAVGNRPVVNDAGVELVNQMLRKGEISTSPVVGQFEREFADYVGARYSLMCGNGTSTINSALFSCGIRQGDEVLVPSYTFWATVSPILVHKGTPVFCDVDPDTYMMTPQTMEPRLTDRTKAIVIVHVWGSAADMDSIMAFARKNNLKVIEDCSHAHGTRYKGKPVGLFGDVGCYSLQGSKLMPGGEAGILVTNSREAFERACALGHYERLGNLPDDSSYRKYRMTGLGEKFRVHPLAAALALTSLHELDARNAIRNANGHDLERQIADLPFLRAQKQAPGGERVFSYHYMDYVAEALGGISTDTFLKAVNAEGVICGYCGYGRLHTAPAYTEGGAYGDCGVPPTEIRLPVTERLAIQTVMVAPRFENPCPELVSQYADAYRKISDNRDVLLAWEEANGSRLEVDMTGRSITLVR